MRVADNNMNSKTIISIHSQKGGVGKTLIGLTLAYYYSIRKKKAVFIDADLTGTSVNDIFLSSGLESNPFDDFRGCVKQNFITFPEGTDYKKHIFLNHYLFANPYRFQEFLGRGKEISYRAKDTFAKYAKKFQDRRKEFLEQTVWERSLIEDSPSENISLHIVPSSSHHKDVEMAVPQVMRTTYNDFLIDRLKDLIKMLFNEDAISEAELPESQLNAISDFVGKRKEKYEIDYGTNRIYLRGEMTEDEKMELTELTGEKEKVEELFNTTHGYDVVIIDTSPSLYGLSGGIYDLLFCDTDLFNKTGETEHSEFKRWKSNIRCMSILVTTCELNDIHSFKRQLRSDAESIIKIHPTTRYVFNKYPGCLKPHRIPEKDTPKIQEFLHRKIIEPNVKNTEFPNMVKKFNEIKSDNFLKL